MKVCCLASFLLFGAFLAATSVDGARTSDNTITKVVKLLQKMLDQSKKDADSDKETYAKFKCYVDTNKAEKTAAIKKATEDIAIAESKIAELQAANGKLANECATLNADMTQNKAEQKFAKDVRKSSKEAFDAMEEDLTKGIGQMEEAIAVLESIGLSQKGSSVHKASLLSLGTKARAALTAASALLAPEKRKSLESFLQSGQSTNGDAIVGVLKTLKTTFEGNLKSAQDSEKTEKKAFEDSIEVLEDSWTKMDDSNTDKESKMGKNDDSLVSQKELHESTTEQKEDDEEFLRKLIDTAETKAKNYEERKMLRANEDAAIAEAISILNSDSSFATFGTTDATSTGATGAASFLQMRQLRGASAQEQAQTILERAAAKGHSMRLARIASHLRVGNVFTGVLEEIEKMKKTIDEEGQADQEKFDWCKKERENSGKDLDAKKNTIEDLEGDIDRLETDIGAGDPITGLLEAIETKETDIAKNQQDQKDKTKVRGEENANYKVDVHNLAEAERILAKAIAVLKRYYDQLEKQEKATNFLQEDPKPPELYDSFEGQKGDGNKAIDMLEFIHEETKKEHSKADSDEESALSDYNGEMETLTKDEEDMSKALVNLKAELATKQKKLEEAKIDLKETTAAKEAIEKYLEQIKPGCDFIKDNKDLRDENRLTETTALNKAKTLIKETPAYKAAAKKDADLAAGKCKSECKLDTTSLKCKVCMSGTDKAAYCGKHPGTAGCK